jgi:hypothetical protein
MAGLLLAFECNGLPYTQQRCGCLHCGSVLLPHTCFSSLCSPRQNQPTCISTSLINYTIATSVVTCAFIINNIPSRHGINATGLRPSGAADYMYYNICYDMLCKQVGRDFLLRGPAICTQWPLVLQLISPLLCYSTCYCYVIFAGWS